MLDAASEAQVRELFASQPFMAYLGVTIARMTRGEVDLVLAFRPELGQQDGFFHGGVIGTLADSCAGIAGATAMPPGSNILTVEYKLNIFAPGQGDRLIARGSVIKSGRRLTIARAEIAALRDGVEKPVATALQTLMVLPKDA